MVEPRESLGYARLAELSLDPDTRRTHSRAAMPGETIVAREFFDMGEIARSILAELERHEPARETHLGVQQDLVAEADPSLVRILPDNLLSNARDQSARKPAATIRVGPRSRQGEVVHFVKDQGVELVTVRRIVERHGGRILAESRPGEGATFCFTLHPYKGPS